VESSAGFFLSGLFGSVLNEGLLQIELSEHLVESPEPLAQIKSDQPLR
jgi:hypothetical protein